MFPDDESNDQPIVEGPSSLEKAEAYLKDNPLFGGEEKPEPTPDTKPPAEAAVVTPEKTETKPPEQTPEEKTAAEAKAKEDAAKQPPLDEKAILEHPKYKELAEAAKVDKDLLGTIHGIIHENKDFPIDSPEALRDTIADAHTLYNIAMGKQKVGDLLSLFEQNWKPENFKAVLLDLADYLAGKDVKVPELDPRKPEHRELIRLRSESDERRVRETEAAVVKTRQEATTRVANTVADLCAKAGVAKEDVYDFQLLVTASLGADQKIMQLIESGKGAAEIQRLFTEHHNRELARQKRWLDAKVAAGEKRETELPKLPVRDGAPAAKGTDKPYKDRSQLQTSDGRLKAANDYWKQSA